MVGSESVTAQARSSDRSLARDPIHRLLQRGRSAPHTAYPFTLAGLAQVARSSVSYLFWYFPFPTYLYLYDVRDSGLVSWLSALGFFYVVPVSSLSFIAGFLFFIFYMCLR
jgi:hypothetical protein